MARIFQILGAPVYYADDRAKWLMVHDQVLKNQIISEFGAEAYQEDGSLNTQFLAGKVFSDTENTQKINSLVHPVVKSDFEHWAAQKDSPYVLKEAALLFETGSYMDLDTVINVSAPLKTRININAGSTPDRSADQCHH